MPGVEVVQRGHRYVVCWPSVHPEGRRYRWRDPSGEVADRPPDTDDCTFLDCYIPLLEPVAAHSDREPVEVDLTDGEPSPPVAARLQVGLDACRGDRGSRHDAVTPVVAALVRLAERGEPGVTAAIRELRGVFVTAVAADRPDGRRQAEREYDDLVDGAVRLVASTDPPGHGEGGAGFELHDVTFREFAAESEEGAAPLLGDGADIVIPTNGDVMMYGDGGAGKTTLAVDLACHLGAGDDWLTITVAGPCNVIAVENEGPRPLFRDKVDRKLGAWTGSAIDDDRLRIVDEPWAAFTFATAGHRAALARLIHARHADVVIVGPLAAAGMNEAGTLQEVRAFLALLADVRRRADRPVTFVLIHHENKGGKVSGAWEGCGDTLLHVTGMGHGRTRLYVQKARWSSKWHAQTLELHWTDGDGFEVEEKPEVSDDDLAELILSAIAENPGTGWTKVDRAITGVRAERKRIVRDRLLADRQIVNFVRVDGSEVVIDRCEQGKHTRLYLADDPAIRQLRPDADEVGTKSSSAGVGVDQTTSSLRPVRSTDEVRDEVFRDPPDQLDPDAEPSRPTRESPNDPPA